MINSGLKKIVFIALLLLLLAISIIAGLSIGEINFSLSEVIDILSRRDGMEYTIISNLRIPRILLGIGVGGALSLSGVILQGIYRNPLVEPYTLGISGGAALGVGIVIASGVSSFLGSLLLPIAGFIGAVLTVIAVFFMSVSKSGFSVNKMLLIGVMISFMSSSAMMFILATTSAENLHSIIFWTMGSLDETNRNLVIIVFTTSLIGLMVSYIFVNHLNALRLGESKAMHLGINTKFTIRLLFVLSSLLTGISVSVTGVIGFVGLVIPHILRGAIGSDYKSLLISSFIGGAIFIILSDIVSRTVISPNELPIGVITGITGGIVFIFVINRSKNKQ